jgi:predicted TIM-barrel fold metal-dependent hydrolase
MLLRDYAPRPTLRLSRHEISRARFPVVDAHNHLGSEFAGEWPARPVGELLAELDEVGVETVVDLDGGWGDQLEHELDRYGRPHPDRFVVFGGLDYASWEQDDDFGSREADRLRRSADAGARGLKVWKVLGLRARDPAGRLVPVDDARLDPLWAAAGDLGLPIVIHVADPIAFFQPLDRHNERWEELREHPDWHFYPTRPRGEPAAHGFPPFDELIEGLRAVLMRHPATVFIGAHVGCAPEDLAWVSETLERCPNFNVDIAARIGELGRQPYTARDFFLRHADRILFGLDLAPNRASYRISYRFLETRDESFPYDVDEIPGQGRWLIHGLGLPDEVLRSVYADNARRLILKR